MLGRLRVGIGGESPYGGTITRKEIIGLDPAIDASGQAHPNRFIPRLRVYVQGVSPTGGEMYYDAPMTQNGSTEEGDKVVAIDVKRGMDWMGNMGLLSEIVKRPDLASKLKEGDDGKSDAYIDAMRNKARVDNLTALTRPKPKLLQMRDGSVIAAYDDGSAEPIREAAPKAPTAVDQARIKEIEARTARTQAEVAGTLPARPKAGGKGGGGEGGGGGKGKPTMSDDAITLTAERLLAGNAAAVSGLARSPANMIAVQNRFAELAKAQGLSGKDAALRFQEYMGLGAAQRALGTRSANFGMAKAEADEMAAIVLDTSEAYGRTNFQPINKALNYFETNTGGTEIRQFGAAINSFINAYARAISPVGQVTVSDKNHARELLSAADSPAQVRAVMATLKQEMEAAGRAPGRVKEDLRSGFSSGLAGGAPAPAPAAAGGTYSDAEKERRYQAWKAQQAGR
jgi:hypothetical protein